MEPALSNHPKEEKVMFRYHNSQDKDAKIVEARPYYTVLFSKNDDMFHLLVCPSESAKVPSGIWDAIGRQVLKIASSMVDNENMPHLCYLRDEAIVIRPEFVSNRPTGFCEVSLRQSTRPLFPDQDLSLAVNSLSDFEKPVTSGG